MKTRWLSAVALAAVLSASSAAASVVYSFTGPVLGLGFTLTTADYITSTTVLPASSLDSCNPLPPFSSPCLSVTFAPSAFDVLTLTYDLGSGSTTQTSFTFLPGTFQTEGTHTAPGALLTVTAVNAAIPEPETWAVMLVGFGAIGLMMRRRKQASSLPGLTA